MKIKFTDSFWKSLKTLNRHQSWWYKSYEVIRYKLPMFFENIWFFRKEMWNFRSWDYTFNLNLFARSLEKTENTLEYHGNEIEISRMKKVFMIKRAVKLIRNINEGDYTLRAEIELGDLKNIDGWFSEIEDTPEEKEHNKKVFELSSKIEDDEWKELFFILQGQDMDEYRKLYDNKSEEEKMSHDVWNNWYDGSGMKNWWD